MDKNVKQQLSILKGFVNQIETLMKDEEKRTNHVIMPHPDMVVYLTNAQANLATCYYNLVVNVGQSVIIDEYQNAAKKKAGEKEYSGVEIL